MRRNKRIDTVRWSVLILLVHIVFLAKGQNIHHVLEQLKGYDETHHQEKIYLQLDKYAYTAGETIWFKAYVTIGVNNLLSNWSNIAYVELIDATEQKIDSLIIPLAMGIGIGDFALADSVREGSYRLRAYTKWMRNDDDKYFYDRTIHISNGRLDRVLAKTILEPGEKNNKYHINLKTDEGAPLVKTSLRYEVIQDGKIVERKRLTTSSEGDLTIELAKKVKDAFIHLHFVNPHNSMVHKVIKLVDPDSLGHVQLYPEGGSLLAGVINTLGVKSVDSQGLGKKVKLVFTIGSDTIANYLTNDLGMGAVNLFLHEGDSVLARAIYDDGMEVPVAVPRVYSSGYSMQVNNQQVGKLFMHLNVSSDLLTGKEVYLIVHHLGQVMYVSKQKVSKTNLSFTVPKEGLPTGVMTITILDEKYIPVLERPFFNFNKGDLLPVRVGLDKEVYDTREKVKVSIHVGGNDTLNIAALSASVVNLSKIKDDPYVAPNILSTLWLSSDLNGFIENPGFYFEKDSFKSLDMDFLMLTQGWRKLNWSRLGGEDSLGYDVEKRLSISGYTKKIGRSKPEVGAHVQLISTHNYMDFLDTISNEEGYFNFDNLLYVDSVKFLISAKNSKGKNNIDIVYDKPKLAIVGANKNHGEELWDVNRVYVDEIGAAKKYFLELEKMGLKDKVIQIEEVVVQRQQNPKVSKNSSNLNGPGNADQVISSEDLAACSTLEMCLAGRLLGVTWQGGVPYNTRGNVQMQVVLDGMFIEADQLAMINVMDVESVEVLRNINYTAIYGSNGGGGLIVITSKTGEGIRRNYTPRGLITIQPKGLYLNREFYKPVYDVPNSLKYMQDLRTTIHWEPLIVTNKDGHASFNFFTSDEKGKHILVLEGLNLEGKIARELRVLEVNP